VAVFQRKNIFSILVIMMVLGLMFTGVACTQQDEAANDKNETINFAASTWDSSKVNTEIVSFIITNGIGYKTQITSAASNIELVGIGKGDLDVRIENWTKTYGEEYYEPVEEGKVLEINEIMKKNRQGIYVPTFMIEGDAERGIEPMAPDLKSIFDLPDYWELFKDPENPEKGRIVGAPTTWSTGETLVPKIKAYGLDEYFTYFTPGSGPTLATAIASAVEKGEPVVAYYWEPTWLLGKYDMTRLEEPEFDESKYTEEAGYACQYPADRITVTINKSMTEKAPEVVDLLKNFEMTAAKMNEILAYMQDNDAEAKDAAIWYLKNNKDVWTKWVGDDVAEKVNSEL